MVTVEGVIAVEAILMLGLTLYTVIFLLLQQRREKSKAAIKDELSVKVMEAFLEMPVASDFRMSLSLSSRLQIEVFRDVLVEMMSQVSGNERTFLVSLYREYGFVNEDLRLCRSVFWARRLEGLIRINSLRDTSFTHLIQDLTSDSNPAVASAAFLCLSEVPISPGQSSLLGTLPEFMIQKKDLLVVLVKNILIANGPDYLQNYLLDKRIDSSARAKCTLVLAQSKSIETLPALVDYLAGEPDLSTDDLLLVLSSILDSLDAEQMTRLFRLAWHPEGRVRARLLEAALPLGLAQAWAFARDQDRHVRAVIAKYKNEEAA
jgi:hypothetical protein